MKQRVLWKMFLLEIVTFGIYRLYYLISTRNEMMKRDPNVKIKSPWFLLAPILVIIVSLFVVIGSVIASANKVRQCQADQPATTSVSTTTSNSVGDTELSTTQLDTPTTTTTTATVCNGSTAANVTGLGAMLVFYLGLFVAFIMYIIWLWGYCHGVEITTAEKLSFPVSLVIMILVPDGIDILIIQDSFNKLGATPALAGAGTTAAGPVPLPNTPSAATFAPTGVPMNPAPVAEPTAPTPAPDHSLNQAPTIEPLSTPDAPPAASSEPVPPVPPTPPEPPVTPGAGPTISPSA